MGKVPINFAQARWMVTPVIQIFLDLTRRLDGKLPSVRGDVTKGGGKQLERRASEQAPTPAKFNMDVSTNRGPSNHPF